MSGIGVRIPTMADPVHVTLIRRRLADVLATGAGSLVAAVPFETPNIFAGVPA